MDNIPDSPEKKRERLFNQDQRLLRAAKLLAESVRALPQDPKFLGAKPRALLVGGFVRDAMIGLHPKDADMEVYGVPPERLEQLLERLFPGKTDAVGRAFGIIKVFPDPDVAFDVSVPRHESKSGKGHAGFLIQSDPAMSVAEASRRRDFTMNSLSADPLTGEVIDPSRGLEDMKKSLLRVTDAERFQDDPLRVYRAVQFAARMGYRVEPKSFELMRGMTERGDLRELSKERVTEEIKKLLLKAERPSVGFWLMRELGIIERDYPELCALIGTQQEPEWHPEGDVWVHTMMVMDHAAKISKTAVYGSRLTEEERLGVMLGALCHDLGKPATTRMGEKAGMPRIRSLGHEEAGEAPTKSLFARMAFSQNIERAAVNVAMQHLKPGMLFLQKEKGSLSDEAYVNAVRKLLKRIHPLPWRVLLAASEADYRGRAVPGVETHPYAAGELFAKTVLDNRLDEAPTKPLVQGRDLLAYGVKPGVRMGEIIRRIENLRDEGKIKTRTEALAALKKLIR